MAPTRRFVNIISIALAAVLALSNATPTSAVSVQGAHHAGRSHHDIAMKRTVASKRANSRRCAAKSSSSVPTTTTKAKATTTKKAAAVATTKASSSSSSSSSSSGLRGKPCLAWPNGDANDLAPWKGNVGLIYSWGPDKVPGAEELGMTFAPMLWGYNQVDEFQSKVVKGYATYALGMNEPNEVGQSNMNAQDGISLWRKYLLPLQYEGYTLISPAMSSRPNGKDWMAEFMGQCGTDCAIKGIATHYYGTDIEEFKDYINYWYDTYHLPVYITEYADQDFNGGPQASMDEIWAFMTAATDFVNSNDWIHAHCWFGAMEDMTNVNTLNKLMNSAGTAPNSLGEYFINN